ncbi:MAG: precorrin-3B C(17)-methyltransferase [Thermodesulfobacteriaceae bacterium]|nr:precorrin-3B C(17)-methyltransferase [Thermodesulfobacteriaceae bacterium]
MEVRGVIFYLSERGKKLAENLKALLKEVQIFRLESGLISKNWQKDKILIFICASGIVVRKIAPFLKNKLEDPGVLVLNETGEYVIPLLGGHRAKANELAQKIADFLSAKAVVTTASDSLSFTPLDLWIKEKGLILKNPELLPGIMALFNQKGTLRVYREKSVKIPLFKGALEVGKVEEAEVIITNRIIGKPKKQLILIVPNLWLGVGFHENLEEAYLEEAVKKVFEEYQLEEKALKGVTTLDKKAKHQALLNFCVHKKLSLLSFSKEELEKVKALTPSEKVYEAVGLESVSEQAALLASKGALLIPKQVFSGLTIAVAEEDYQLRGKLYIVGTGPGAVDFLTLRALQVLREAEVIVGYQTYLKLLEPLFYNKEVYSFSMTEETERAKKAIEEALKGKKVALVSGGDPGIYGMSGLVLEILTFNRLSLDLEIIPGISALNACSALVGAPLMNDFAVISLSDRLTPWEEIEKRLRSLAQLDIPLVIYNPKSRRRSKQFSKALEILKTVRALDTVVAVVISAMRENQKIYLTTLRDLKEEWVDMHSTLIVGNSQSFFSGNWFITSRGYEKKYSEEYFLKL